MPGFNLARKVEVGGQNNDCGLNCLAHVLSTCLEDADPIAKNSLLAAYQKLYGNHYTLSTMLTELRGLTPRQREKKFSPVLRKLYATAYHEVQSSPNGKQALSKLQGQPRASLEP